MKTHTAYILPVLVLCLVLIVFSIALARSPSASPADETTPKGQSFGPVEIPTNQIIVKFRPQVNLNMLSGQALEVQEQRLSQAAGQPVSYVRTMSGEASSSG